MKLRMYNFCKTTELYELEIDEHYAESLTSHFKSIAVHPELIPTITVEMIAQAWHGDEEEELNFEAKGYNDSTYVTNLYDEIRDCMGEDVWDEYVETVDSETYDTDYDLIDD